MSPEQARGLKVDARTDIFSLGVVLYEMITSRQPFEGATMMDVIAAILDREPAPLNLHDPGAPAELQRIVSLALRKGLEERYQTSRELLVDLKNLKQEQELESRIQGAGQPRAGGETKVSTTGETINIRTQLIRVSDGALLWSGEFVRPLANLPLLHDSVMTQVAEALALKLTDEQRQKLKRRYRDDAEAYQAYLKGRYFWNRRGAGWHQGAIEAFERAIAIDPNYALAYAGLADTYIILGDHGLVPPKDVFPKAREAAIKALELDESLVEAHTALALVISRFDWDALTAEREFKRAIELDPGYALAASGRRQEAIRILDELKELSARRYLKPYLIALIHVGLGDHEQALEHRSSIRFRAGKPNVCNN